MQVTAPGDLARCYNEKQASHRYYGPKGIIVCDEWLNSFEAFFAYVGRKPTPLHSIERIDNNGNYEPGNVKWATSEEQNRNKRDNLDITIDGVTKCLKEWALILGASHKRAYDRWSRGVREPAALFGPPANPLLNLRGYEKAAKERT